MNGNIKSVMIMFLTDSRLISQILSLSYYTYLTTSHQSRHASIQVSVRLKQSATLSGLIAYYPKEIAASC